MMQLIVMTEQEKREEARIRLRRLREEERKKRIFNPKTRMIGIDVETLEEQIKENERKRDEEFKLNEMFMERLKKADFFAVANEEKQRKEKRRIEKEINEFRRNHQKFEHAREFDLNDSDFIKKQHPMRLNDECQLGPSSAQKFEGEDLLQPERLALQKEQFRSSLEQQMKEKNMFENQRKMSEEIYNNAVLVRDRRALQMAELERDCRLKLHLATQRFNVALNEEKKSHISKLKKQTNDDNTSEIYNAIVSNFLTENPEVAQSNLSHNRKICYLYKGMSNEERAAYRQAQLEQIEERNMKDYQDRSLEKQFYDYFDEMQRRVLKLDSEIEIEKRKFAKQLEQENLQLSVKQKGQIMSMNRSGFSNVPNEKYFEQFNQSTR